jgi:hypothetical protein
MSDKTSQKTEDEMLDQTFGGYDDEMTVNTEQTQTSETGAKPKAEKKKSNNTLVYAGGGVAAILILGYMFMGGNKSAPQQHVAAPAQQPVATQTPPVQQPPQAVTDNTQAQVPQSGSAQNAAAAYLSAQGNANNAVPNQAASVAPASSADSLNNTAPVTQASAPEVQQPVMADNTNSTPAAPVIVASTPAPVVINTAPATPAVQTGSVGTNAGVGANSNEVQVALVNQLKQMFDQQTKELKGSLDQVGDRVGNLEKAVSDQKDINKQIDERLARLEAGKPTKVVKVEKTEDTGTTVAASDTTKAKTEKAPAEHKVRHVVRRHVVRKAVSESDSSNVIIDKSQAPAASTVSALPSVDIYSIYAGRVWTRNGDGTLSTYSAGDRLPTGEVVRSVDDNHLVTNKRVINAK